MRQPIFTVTSWSGLESRSADNFDEAVTYAVQMAVATGLAATVVAQLPETGQTLRWVQHRHADVELVEGDPVAARWVEDPFVDL